jgi:hypothetical protein
MYIILKRVITRVADRESKEKENGKKEGGNAKINNSVIIALRIIYNIFIDLI